MAAEYDTYDYPSYWQNRDYEHESEIIVLKEFLSKIPRVNKIAEIGCGFGRLTPYYAYRAKKTVLIDPSKKLLDEAKKRLTAAPKNLLIKPRNLSFQKGTVEGLPKLFKAGEFDVVIMVRVMHHIIDPQAAISALSSLLRPGGYLILEFANKIHGKATFSNILHGNFTYPIDIFPADKKTHTKANAKSLPFLNYHPDVIYDILKKNGLKVLETRSVSNIRSPFLKKHVPIPVLVSVERYLQKSLARIHFGPSIFVLARKKG